MQTAAWIPYIAKFLACRKDTTCALTGGLQETLQLSRERALQNTTRIRSLAKWRGDATHHIGQCEPVIGRISWHQSPSSTADLGAHI